MKNRILVFCISMLFVFTSEQMSAQQITYKAGYVSSKYFSFADNNSTYYYNGSYEFESGPGFYLGLGLEMGDEAIVKSLDILFTSYKGKLFTGFSSFNEYDFTSTKQVVDVSMYMYNFRLWKGNTINLGVNANLLLRSQAEGTVTTTGFAGTFTTDINAEPRSINRKLNLGPIVGINQDFRISNSFTGVVSYSFYAGLTHDFNNIPNDPRNRRHYVGLGVKKTITR